MVAQLSVEVEYRGMTQGACELLCLRKLLEELKLLEENKLSLYCDSKVAISIAQNLVQHDRPKNIDIGRHFIKKKLTTGS